MAGTKGKITRARGETPRSVYIGDKFGVWPEKGGLHVTFLKDTQKFHTSLTQKDGLIYEVFLMLHAYGLRQSDE